MFLRLATPKAAAVIATLLLFALTFTITGADSSRTPTNLIVKPTSDSLNLSWTPGTDEEYNKVHSILHWEQGKQDTTESGALASGGIKSITWPDGSIFKPGTTYVFQVSSLKSSEDENGWDTWETDENNVPIVGGVSETVSYTTAGEPPDDQDTNNDPVLVPPDDDPADEPAPEPEPEQPESTPNASDFTAVQQGDAAVLNWTPGNDTRIDYQHIKRRERGKGDWTTIRVAADASSYTDNGVSIGKKYIYRIESWSDTDGKIGLSRPAKVKME